MKRKPPGLCLTQAKPSLLRSISANNPGGKGSGSWIKVKPATVGQAATGSAWAGAASKAVRAAAVAQPPNARRADRVAPIIGIPHRGRESGPDRDFRATPNGSGGRLQAYSRPVSGSIGRTHSPGAVGGRC